MVCGGGHRSPEGSEGDGADQQVRSFSALNSFPAPFPGTFPAAVPSASAALGKSFLVFSSLLFPAPPYGLKWFNKIFAPFLQ